MKKNLECKIWNIFLSISLNIRCGYSKEWSHKDGSFEYPQHMFWFRNKKTTPNPSLNVLNAECPSTTQSVFWSWIIINANLCDPLKKFLALQYLFLPWKCCLFIMSAACIQVHVRLDFIMEANTLNPDQTVWSGSILFAIYWLLKKISRWESRWQKLWLAGKKLRIFILFSKHTPRHLYHRLFSQYELPNTNQRSDAISFLCLYTQHGWKAVCILISWLIWIYTVVNNEYVNLKK